MTNYLIAVEKYVWRSKFRTSRWIDYGLEGSQFGKDRFVSDGTRCRTSEKERQMSTTQHSKSRMSIHCCDGTDFGSRTSTIGATNAFD